MNKITRRLPALLLNWGNDLAFVNLRTSVRVPLRLFSSGLPERLEMAEFTEYMEKLKNYEKIGVPKGAGTDSSVGFDLDRMRRLLYHLGNPHYKFKAVHIAGTKGKGSTAAFLSSILRAEGYSVGCYSSPHIRTIRERISLGTTGEPVSAAVLNSHFHKIKEYLDKAVELEKGQLSQFEVFTAVAFSLFAEEKVDFGVIEAGLGGARDATNVITASDLAVSVITNVGAEHLAALGGSLENIAAAKSGIIKKGRPLVIGGPFIPHIEHIIRDRALSLCSPVVSASDPGNRSVVKGFSRSGEVPCQLCDIQISIDRDIHLFIELFDVQLRLLGAHQLQNAATATCAALCLRDQGWKVSDASIYAGLELAYLLGRSQFLTNKEAEMLGVRGATILLDGAHTKESAQVLVNMITMAFPNARLVLVVAMAIDKDHFGFAEVLLSAGCLDAVCFTEVDIAGDRYRTTSSSLLKDTWIQACSVTGADFLDCKVEKYDLTEDQEEIMGNQSILFMEGSLMASMKFGNKILCAKQGAKQGILVFTGSLHIVSAILGSING
ncbi:dihydrofolate synthetase [Andrographis paniculata]|uniref:dihydrofolate synthetase n=1 Tax=Andrographis paniculata TaxID=175694 RepID=UPI0021E91230|nr:dihydrofolate synthetase [Andrographis paniculata]XP_051116416.1 dihydrofolate synthetase [Andrographis paniculata]XP_051116417.1 dihydrofolate synthetase [Andrographis paniculata]